MSTCVIRTCGATRSIPSRPDRRVRSKARVIAGFFLCANCSISARVPLDEETCRSRVWWDAIEPLLGDRRMTIACSCLRSRVRLSSSLASEIGVRFFNTEWDNGLGYSVQRDRGWRPFFALWAGFAIATDRARAGGGCAAEDLFEAAALAARRCGCDHRFYSDVRGRCRRWCCCRGFWCLRLRS